MTSYIRKYGFFTFLIVFGLFSCKQEQSTISDKKEVAKKTVVNKALPEWAKNANLYEVNLRQYTKEGTFAAFQTHLPRLKEMGIDILWFMPIYPISESKRKGTLGSYYAVSDYKAVNPEHGTREDFKALVTAIHKEGMHIILDWVPNHTGWDHEWIANHKNWYTQDSNGNVIDPIDPGTGESWGWTDVADLNYGNRGMRNEMISDMAYWVTELDIDGFRMDVAHNVPDDFWKQCSDHLHSLGKPIFMLAEAELENHRNHGYFHADYGWHMHHLLNGVAKGEKNASDIYEALKEDMKKFKKGFHIHFTSNHDENTWAGTVMDRMGDAHKTLAALTACFDGMTLVYGGQEEPLEHRLKFFEKDDIGFKDYAYQDFYTRLLKNKKENMALWNGEHGGQLKRLVNNDDVFVFQRQNGDHTFVGIFNLSKGKQEISLPTTVTGKDVIRDQTLMFKAGESLRLEPWEFYMLDSR